MGFEPTDEGLHPPAVPIASCRWLLFVPLGGQDAGNEDEIRVVGCCMRLSDKARFSGRPPFSSNAETAFPIRLLSVLLQEQGALFLQAHGGLSALPRTVPECPAAVSTF